MKTVIRKPRPGTFVMAGIFAVLLLGAAGCGSQSADQNTGGASSQTSTSSGGSGGGGDTNTGGATGGAGGATNAQDAAGKVTAAFAGDAKLTGYKLQAAASDQPGMIVIKGTVPDEAEKYRAEQVATDAIKNPTIAVDNQITAGAATGGATGAAGATP